ncbi:MAG: hypothetical protein NZL91_02615 [Thermoflexales bacterium]|nr:hypothetical protein [Thermoflexales bacterium]
MQPSNLLRLDYWLDFAAAQRPLSGWTLALAALATVLGAGLLLAARRGSLAPSLGVPLGIGGLIAGIVTLARWLGVPLLGSRLGWLIAAGLAVMPALARWVAQAARSGVFKDAWLVLGFAPPRGEWSRWVALGWVSLHALGIAFVLANARLPIMLAPLLLGCFALPWAACALGAHWRRVRCAARVTASLAPLVWAYGATLLSGLGMRIEGVFNGVLSPLLTLIVASALAWVAGWWLAAQQFWGERADERFVGWSAAVLLIGALSWSAWTAATLRTHGVSGSDPYAYVQMGVDLVTRGTLLHVFPLAELAYALDIPVHPVVHVGYRLPDASTLEAPTVWPPGFAALTGLAFMLGGEHGVYFLNPALNLLSVLTVFWWAWRTHSVDPVRRASLAALTAFITATSYQQIEWQMVPMADIAAQWLTVLGLGSALVAERSMARAVLSGICLGAAFGVRYTQVLAAPAFALALLLPTSGALHFSAQRFRLVLGCAVGAWLAAAPTLAYHALTFGHPFAVGSEEWQHFSLAQAPATLARLLTALGHYREFGLLAPLMLVGAAAVWRRERRLGIVVATLIFALLGFHALYTYVRPRDVLFLFPFFAWLVAFGVVESTAWLINQRARLWRLVAPTMIWALSMLFVLRSMETLALPVTRGFAGFGHLNAVQRAAFDALQRQTSPAAVIGSTLNTGAVELHANRLAFRPAEWSPAALLRFVEALHARGHAVYILDDGEAQRAVLQTLSRHHSLRRAGELDLPYYDAVGGGSRAKRVALYVVEREPAR